MSRSLDRPYKDIDNPSDLKELRLAIKRFEERNFKRWNASFNIFETMINFSIQVSQKNDENLTENAKIEKDYIFEALRNLQPRGILISQEIYCLLKGGFPDGALARWRSLHEVTVTALFISQHDKKVALNYLASFVFNARRSATQLSKYAERANMTPLSQSEFDDLNHVCDLTKAQIGRAIGGEYDWAREAFDDGKRVKFSDLEERVKMDHWRPRYKWASQHTHAGHRPPDKMLAMCEAEKLVHVVGQSNSGFVDPLHMTAISLQILTTVFLLHKPTSENIVFLGTLNKLADELGEVAMQEDRIRS